jgi:hypothetical protein
MELSANRTQNDVLSAFFAGDCYTTNLNWRKKTGRSCSADWNRLVAGGTGV